MVKNHHIDVTGMTRREDISVFCIPTTSRNLREASRLLSHGEICVVGDEKRFPSIKGAMTPVQMLDACPPRSKLQLSIISFTDQFVCTTNAPLVVELEGLHEYRSSFEVVCSARFRVPILYACSSDWTPPHVVGSESNMVQALALMSRYLDACELLGDEWLARHMQSERSMEYRRRHAVLLRRQYSSLVMAAAINSDLTPTHARIIDSLFRQGRHKYVGQARKSGVVR